MSALLHAMAEHGDIAETLDAAMADGVLDAAEMAAMHTQIREARNALIELENTLKARVLL